MNGIRSQKITTWRKLLKAHSPGFLRWLGESGREAKALDLISSQLADFLIEEIQAICAELPDAAREFWSRIPDVRSCCSKPGVFEKPLAVEAYAYVHLLERYRRTWSALKYMCKAAVLPLGTRGVGVLEVGSGPGPCVHAVEDFFGALNEYADTANIAPLRAPRLELNCIERSQSMVNFFHRFRQFCGRTGPFAPMLSDFAGLDLRDIRGWHQHQNEIITWWNPETGEYEEMFDPSAAAEQANRLHRYRMVIFSNFLTLESDVASFRTELLALFQDLRPGAVVILLGGTGDSYQRIYEDVAGLAKEAGLKQMGWHTDALGRKDAEDSAARVIKREQHRVYQNLEQFVGVNALDRGRDWPNYWNPLPSPKARPRFALRIFRRGRWPKPMEGH